MSSSASPAEACVDERADDDKSSSNGGSTHLRGSTVSASAASPAARLTVGRPYRTTTRDSLAVADVAAAGPTHMSSTTAGTAIASGASGVQPPQKTAAATITTTAANRSPTVPENLSVSRHADVRLSPTAASSPRPIAITTTTATATTPSSVTPMSVRVRGGSTTPHRTYQPSSLFGTIPANLTSTSTTATAAAAVAPAAAAGSSLSSSVALADTTHRCLASTVTNDQNDEESGKASSTQPRHSLETSDGADTLREELGGSARRTAKSFDGSNTVTPRASTGRPGSTGSSGAASRKTWRCGQPMLPSATLAAVRTATANGEVPSPNSVPATAATKAAATVSGDDDSGAGDGDRNAPSISRETCEEDSNALARAADDVVVTSIEAKTAEVQLPLADAESGCDKAPSTAPSERWWSPALDRTSPKDDNPWREAKPTSAAEEDEWADLKPLSMSSLVEYVAVPASVQAVLKNPAATKTELWVALRTACQQCKLLQRRLAKLEGQLTVEDEAAAAAAVATSSSFRNEVQAERNGADAVTAANNAPRGGGKENGGDGTRMASSSRAPMDTPCENDAAPDDDSSSSNNSKNSNDDRNTRLSAGRTSAGALVEQERSTRDRASVTPPAATTTAAAATPASPLSLAALRRGNARLTSASSGTSPSSAASKNIDASTALRNRIAEEIRRVEATRKDQQANQSEASRRSTTLCDNSSSSSQQKTKRELKEEDNAVAGEETPTTDRHNSRTSGGAGAASVVTVKLRDKAARETRKVREAVVKSRETEPWPSLTSPPQLSRETRLLSQTDDEENVERGEQRSKNEAQDPGEKVRAGENDAGNVEGNNRDVRQCRRSSSGGGVADRVGLRRHPSNVSDTISVKSGNGFALPSLPSASVDTVRRSSFSSRSHNSGRVAAALRPPSSLASESVAASGTMGSAASPQQAYHRRLHGASFASVESASNGREGSIASSGPDNVTADGAAPSARPVLPISMQASTALTASTTLPVLRREDIIPAPLSARPSQPHRSLVEGEAHAASSTLHCTSREEVLPSIHSSSSSPSQKSVAVARSPPRSFDAGVCGVSASSPLDPSRSRPVVMKAHPSLVPEPSTQLLLRNSASHSADNGNSSNGGVVGGASNHSSLSAAPLSVLEMVREIAEEDAPIPPPCDKKRAELREWRRQAAKAGLRGAPAA